MNFDSSRYSSYQKFIATIAIHAHTPKGKASTGSPFIFGFHVKYKYLNNVSWVVAVNYKYYYNGCVQRSNFVVVADEI